MMSRTLWRKLRSPDDINPLFWRIVRDDTYVDNAWSAESILFLAMLMGYAFIPGSVVILNPFVFLFLVGLLFGLSWGVTASIAIAKERRRHTYDLLVLALDSRLSVGWSIYVGMLYHNRRTDGGFSGMALAIRMAMVALWMVLIAIMNSTNGSDQSAFYLLLLVAALVGVYLDFVQSVVLNGLIAVAVGTSTRSPSAARLWSGISVVAAQVTVYLATALTFGFASVLYTSADGSWLIAFIVPTITLAVFWGVREAIITMLWRGLATHTAESLALA